MLLEVLSVEEVVKVFATRSFQSLFKEVLLWIGQFGSRQYFEDWRSGNLVSAHGRGGISKEGTM